MFVLRRGLEYYAGGVHGQHRDGWTYAPVLAVRFSDQDLALEALHALYDGLLPHRLGLSVQRFPEGVQP